MGDQDSQGFNFLAANVILILAVLLVIFGYLVLLIRKRWRQNFLHSADKREDQK
jgi:Flp pilus assembly protein CpaB